MKPPDLGTSTTFTQQSQFSPLASILDHNPTYHPTRQVSTRLSEVRVYAHISQTQPGEQVIIQSARSCSKRPRTTRRRVRPTCTNCNKDFVRVQEFKRHLKDIHEPRSQCPFCDFTWTRPDKIKAHIMARHQGKFTAEQLVDFDALRGQKIVAFLRVQM